MMHVNRREDWRLGKRFVRVLAPCNRPITISRIRAGLIDALMVVQRILCSVQLKSITNPRETSSTQIQVVIVGVCNRCSNLNLFRFRTFQPQHSSIGRYCEMERVLEEPASKNKHQSNKIVLIVLRVQ